MGRPALRARATEISTTMARIFRRALRAAGYKDGDRFIEIWTCVFMQNESNSRTDHARPLDIAVDRHRMGLEP